MIENGNILNRWEDIFPTRSKWEWEFRGYVRDCIIKGKTWQEGWETQSLGASLDQVLLGVGLGKKAEGATLEEKWAGGVSLVLREIFVEF